MKRAVAFLLALTVFGAAGLVCAHRVVGASAEAVEMYETVLAGDRAAAEGVEVSFGTHCAGRLHWDSSLSIGAENAVTTDFCFTPYDERTGADISSGSSYVYLSARVNTSGEAGTAVTGEGALRSVVRDVASRTQPLESRTETVFLGDYFEYFPVYVGVKPPLGWDAEELARVLEKRFKIPLPEDWQLDVRVTCNAHGGIAEYQTYPTLGGEPGLDCLCAVSAEEEKTLWLAVQTESWDDGSIEYPGAGCLYSWDGGGELTRELEFAADERVERMDFDARGRLVMLVSRDGALYLRVYGTGLECLQETELMTLGEEDGINRLVVGDNFIFAGGWNGRFALAELTESGEYVPRLADEMYEPDMRYVYQDSAVLRLWDGERLVMASALYSGYSVSDRFLGVIVWVYDETGLAFCARYDCSQCIPETENWGYYVGLEQGPSLSLR